MAKKFGKTLLLSAAVVSAAAAVYFYLQKKDAAEKDSEEEDYDDFSEGPNESSRNYVPLNHDASTQQAQDAENADSTPSAESTQPSPSEPPSVEEFPIHKDSSENTFTPLTEQAAENAAATEEFFDESDDPEAEPPISDN